MCFDNTVMLWGPGKPDISNTIYAKITEYWRTTEKAMKSYKSDLTEFAGRR